MNIISRNKTCVADGVVFLVTQNINFRVRVRVKGKLDAKKNTEKSYGGKYENLRNEAETFPSRRLKNHYFNLKSETHIGKKL